MKITAVVPCYNEQEALGLFYEELNRVTAEMRDCEFEILFVNDGSKDRTLELMKELAEKDGRVKYISFSRNFGKEAAIYAGLEHASGDLVAIMDADLQDPPRLLPEMYRAVTEEGYDSVATRRVTRKGEPPIRSFFARMFYRLMNKMCKTEVVDGARDFRLMTRPFVDSLLSMKEYNRFSKGLFGWVGFRTKWIEFENVERVAGETKWFFLETAFVCDRWDGRVFHHAAFRRSADWNFNVRDRGDLHHFHHCPPAVFWRFGVWLAVHGLHHDLYRRGAAALYGNYGTVSGENLSGSEEPSDLYLQRDEYRRVRS